MRQFPAASRLAVTLTTATALLSISVPAGGAPTPARAVRISAGAGTTCALLSTGTVRCWGYNVQGQLGDGMPRATIHSSTVPVTVRGLAGVRAISQGGFHGCALGGAGAVRCWGWNNLGQLGSGDTGSQHNVPVGVRGLGSGVVSVSAGGAHTCAVTSAGAVKCWGGNGNWQLGITDQRGSRVPVDVPGLGSGFTAVVAGGGASTNGGTTCALTAGRGVKCLGINPGNGANGCCSTTPVDVAGLTSGVASLGAGDGTTCAITTAGALKCWGDNSWGKLGDGTGTRRASPVDVLGLSSGAKQVVVGQAHTCALTTAGGVKCWGFNRDGQVGNGTRRDQGPMTPVDVVGLRSGVVQIAAGQAHTCALLTTGRVKCWGDGSTGALGRGSRLDSPVPVDVRLGTTAPATAGGGNAAVRTFVSRLEPILVESAAGRRELAAAISAGLRCSISTQAAAGRIARVVDNRNRLLLRLSQVSAPTTRAAQAVALLRVGLQHSIEADRRYRDGFLASRGARCPLPRNASFVAAGRSDTLASAAKRRFVAAYNPLARQVNRRTWSASEI
jgi:alpha-tubulin suppressor-like RCC1 family protein